MFRAEDLEKICSSMNFKALFTPCKSVLGINYKRVDWGECYCMSTLLKVPYFC